ncbi:MAG: hypothetical protein [Inoviridae sp.]|nr:MAG: hypothetical protein [Inoviridae sp.]
MLIRRFFAFVISAFLIFFPAYSYSASPVGWVTSPADIIIGGVNATVTAIKGAGASALQSTVKHAPNAAKLGTKLLRGAGAGAVLMAVSQILGKAVDYTLDPANNRVIYTDLEYPPSSYQYKDYYGKIYSASTMMGVCNAIAAEPPSYAPYFYELSKDVYGQWNCKFSVRADGSGGSYSFPVSFMGGTPKPVEKYIPIAQVSAKVISNSAAGDVPSQEVVKTVIIDDVNAGVLDVPLNTNAVPVADAPPVNPPHDPTQPAPPFDPSSIIAAIKSVMAAVVNMSGVLGAKIDSLMIDLGLKHEEKLVADAANTAEIVAANDRTGAQVAAIAAAIADIEGNTLDGKVINDAIDRAIAAGHTDTASIVAAIEAIEGNTLDGQVINDAVDRVIANDNVNAQSAADAANTAAEAAKAADAANTAAVTDAIEAQTDAITEVDPVTGEMSLKFPKFCSWALPVCDFFGWVAEPVPDDEQNEEVGFATTSDVGLDDVNRFEKRITFSGQCPSNEFSFSMMGVTYAKPIPYHHLCGFLEQIAPWLLAMCYLGTAYFVVENI